MSRDRNTTKLQLDILDLWVRGLSTREISEQLQCSRETVRLCKKDEKLKQIFFDRQREQIIELVPFAIQRLRHILRDDSVQPSVQISAVREVLERAGLSEITDKVDKDIKIMVSYE
jgi:DNA replication protein DnaD